MLIQSSQRKLGIMWQVMIAIVMYSLFFADFVASSRRFRSHHGKHSLGKAIEDNDSASKEVGINRLKFSRETYPANHHFKTLDDNSPFPPCSPKIYTTYGILDIGAMLEQCAATIPSALFPPSYYYSSNITQEYYPTNVSLQLSLNSLISVDDLQSQYVIDYFLRIIWTDPRIVFEDSAWDEINPEARTEGLEISSMIRVARK